MPKRKIARIRCRIGINADGHARHVQEALAAKNGVDQVIDPKYRGVLADGGALACRSRVERCATQVNRGYDKKPGVPALVLCQ